ncbi:MAG: 1-deoxy-D-xylulose-5-phosphate synthase [Leptospiraceae bacterium]|nr:1-deoxy-D-xylulose-5-phosphate synthase [Leptospiraceae bacterium]MDW7975420.1 1-deoxy-D-xylulose-5-phosphate synthase [Leptospiraceae bacterium]
MNPSKYPYLSKVDYPEDFRNFSLKELNFLCQDIREYLIETVSETGGHFASNLGVVELTVALHYVFNTPKDKLIWDTGHQTYPHKILTGRKHQLKSVRKFKGISGFPKREESEYDLFNTGHAGTSISQVVGEAIARDLKGEDYKCIAVIGDASIASGMAFEALNHAGHIQTDCLVILNDNDMSISKNVGALNQYLNKIVMSNFYNKSRVLWYKFLYWLPIIGPALKFFSEKFERAIKDFLLPGSLFEDFGFRYFGPIDGHNLKELIEALKKVKIMKGPILLHVITQKGKGYQPAEKNPVEFHSVTKFNRNDGILTKENPNSISFSNIVGKTLIEIFKKNPRAVAITPAMIEGSGLRKLHETFPNRVFDVGIAEQHSIAFSGALASGGLVPYMCIYSTFLNRGIDQLIQDVALMNLPVKLVIDRGGCVGPDGETHQGLYDLGYLYAIPNLRLYAPATGAELQAILKFVEKDELGPIAIRFPKAEENIDNLSQEVDVSNLTPEILYSTNHPTKVTVAIVTIGVMRSVGLELQQILRKESYQSVLIAMRWVKPFDKNALENTIKNAQFLIFIEDSYEFASASMAILEQLSPEAKGKHLKTFAFPSLPIEHGTRNEIFDKYGISSKNISQYLFEVFEKEVKSAISF